MKGTVELQDLEMVCIVHILTGPIYVNDAMPGDLLKVEILDLKPRKNPDGKTFGSNAAAWWGFQARVNKVNGEPFYAGSFSGTPDKNDEVVTIYEIKGDYAIPSYQVCIMQSMIIHYLFFLYSFSLTNSLQLFLNLIYVSLNGRRLLIQRVNYVILLHTLELAFLMMLMVLLILPLTVSLIFQVK